MRTTLAQIRAAVARSAATGDRRIDLKAADLAVKLAEADIANAPFLEDEEPPDAMNLFRNYYRRIRGQLGEAESVQQSSPRTIDLTIPEDPFAAR